MLQASYQKERYGLALTLASSVPYLNSTLSPATNGLQRMLFFIERHTLVEPWILNMHMYLASTIIRFSKDAVNRQRPYVPRIRRQF
jgi:hypothetical protein